MGMVDTLGGGKFLIIARLGWVEEVIVSPIILGIYPGNGCTRTSI